MITPCRRYFTVNHVRTPRTKAVNGLKHNSKRHPSCVHRPQGYPSCDIYPTSRCYHLTSHRLQSRPPSPAAWETSGVELFSVAGTDITRSSSVDIRESPVLGGEPDRSFTAMAEAAPTTAAVPEQWSWLGEYAPMFPIHGSQVKVITEPQQFYQTLKVGQSIFPKSKGHFVNKFCNRVNFIGWLKSFSYQWQFHFSLGMHVLFTIFHESIVQIMSWCHVHVKQQTIAWSSNDQDLCSWCHLVTVIISPAVQQVWLQV